MLRGTLQFKEGDDTTNKRIVSFLGTNLNRFLGGTPGIRFDFNVAEDGPITLLIHSTPIKKYTGLSQIEAVLGRLLNSAKAPQSDETTIERYQKTVLGELFNPDKKTLRTEADEASDNMSNVLQSRLQSELERRRNADSRFGMGGDIRDPLEPAAPAPAAATNTRANNIHYRGGGGTSDATLMHQKNEATPAAIANKGAAVTILKNSTDKDDAMLMAKFMDDQIAASGI